MLTNYRYEMNYRHEIRALDCHCAIKQALCIMQCETYFFSFLNSKHMLSVVLILVALTLDRNILLNYFQRYYHIVIYIRLS